METRPSTLEADRGDRLVDRLEALVAQACAVTLSEAAGAGVDANALTREVGAAFDAIVDRADEMLPLLGRLCASLEAAVERASPAVRDAAWSHRVATCKWRPDPPPMPREAVAFMVLSQLGSARSSCEYVLAKARYQAARAPGDRCDCQARVSSGFLSSRPDGPLTLVDSAGVPYAAMDYLWRCRACGTQWREEEGWDDNGSWSTWRVAPRDAMKA